MKYEITPGKFITFEGGEGVGKSTNIRFVQAWLEARGIECRVTREPGGTPLAEDIRSILLAARDESVDPMAELLLVFAARAQHVNQLIKPALEEGTWVLCDRFTDATYAYQGAGRGLDLEQIEQLENLVQGGFRPDCTVILDAPVEIGMSRAKNRGQLDRFEQEQREFFEKIRGFYRGLANAGGQSRYALVDASVDLESVQEQLSVILQRLV
ncbi:thymidylate kinase [Oleiphilus messinensis]|uniref:Thymidylate kinase n=1 Tax=Oleiphilus messinensis TaxID=141451 RepID=A0A1Y0I957_9GAMM|nr:dTMP kinase [Oleiphilus messinensis]ARU56296.1 thymidylate kinase [Oleiphilus messinensis]